MTERDVSPMQLDQTEISKYMLGPDAKVTRVVEMSDDSGRVHGYKVWYQNPNGQDLTLVLERAP